MAVRMMFEISGDSTPLAKAITSAMNKGEQAAKTGGQKAGSEFGKEFGQQVKGAVLSAIGLGAITAAIKKSVTDAQVIAKEAATSGISVEAAQELQRAAKLTGMSVEDVKASATTAPKEFSALMRYVQKTGGPKMGESDVEELSSIGSGFSSAGSAIGIIASKVTSALTGAGLSAWSALEYGAGNLRYNLGRRDKNTEALMMSGVETEAEAAKKFERMFGIPQGDINNPSSDLVRKLDEIKKTLEKKL